MQSFDGKFLVKLFFPCLEGFHRHRSASGASCFRLHEDRVGLASPWVQEKDNLPPRLTALFLRRVVVVLQALTELAEKVVHEDGISK